MKTRIKKIRDEKQLHDDGIKIRDQIDKMGPSLSRAIALAEKWRKRETEIDDIMKAKEADLVQIRTKIHFLKDHEADLIGAYYEPGDTIGSIAVKIKGRWMIPYKESPDEEYKYRQVKKWYRENEELEEPKERDCTKCGNKFPVSKEFPRGTVCEDCGRENNKEETPSDAFPEETSEELGV